MAVIVETTNAFNAAQCVIIVSSALLVLKLSRTKPEWETSLGITVSYP